MKTIVIEISGGVVQAAYADNGTQIVIVDWDEHEADPSNFCALELTPFSVDCMPEEAEKLIASQQ